MRDILAVFDSPLAADQARTDLLQAGFPAAKVITSPASTVPKEHEKSFWDEIKEFLGFEDRDLYQEAARRGGVLLRVSVDDHRVDQAVEHIKSHHPVDLDRRAEQWRRSGWQPAPVTPATPSKAQVIPVAAEQLRIDKRREDRGGIRIYTNVHEEPVERTLQLHEEHVRIERRPADRLAEAGAFHEQTFEIRETHEEPVIRKEARVVEELVIHKDVRARTEKVQDKLRKTDVRVEELEDEFRKDYDRTFAGKGYTYEQLRPVYNFGTELAGKPRTGSRDWTVVSPEARQSFEQRYPNRPWQEFEPAVRCGYDRACRRQTK